MWSKQLRRNWSDFLKRGPSLLSDYSSPPRHTGKTITFAPAWEGCFKKNPFSSYQKVSFRLGVFLEVIYWTEFDFSLSLLFWVSKLNIWVYFQSFTSNFFSFLYDIAYSIRALNHPHPICRNKYFSLKSQKTSFWEGFWGHLPTFSHVTPHEFDLKKCTILFCIFVQNHTSFPSSIKKIKEKIWFWNIF